jgi:superfamily I DNA and/or RNA helicase
MNRSLPCVIPGPIHLTLASTWPAQLAQKRQRFPNLPDADRVLWELNDLNRRNGVPVVIQQTRQGKVSLQLYVAHYYVGLYPSMGGGGYTLAYIEARNLQACERLAKGTLGLRSSGYIYHVRMSDIPRGSSNYWQWISAAWQRLEAERLQSRDAARQNSEELTPEHESYLNTIDELIDLTRQLEQEKYKLAEPIPYMRVMSVGEQRYVRAIYDFLLANPAQLPEEKYMLRIKEAPELRGRIYKMNGDRITVKFEKEIDRARIPQPGNFEIFSSNVIFNTQERAVSMLREREAKNPHLLRVLVDQRYRPFTPDPQNAEDLNAEQKAAFQCALIVPDVLLILGPPGTGKTRTITEIARHCSSRGKRVLITAGTHQAVDNVLALLQGPQEVIRWGHEDKVAEKTRHLLLDEKARALQQTILDQTQWQAKLLNVFIEAASRGQIIAWLDTLTRHAEQLRNLEERMKDLLQWQAQARNRIEQPYKSSLDELAAATVQREASLERRNNVLQRWQRWQVTLDAKRKSFMIGRLYSLLYSYCEKRVLREQERIDEEQAIYTRIIQEQEAARAAVQQALWADNEYRRSESDKRAMEQSLADVQQQAGKIVALLEGTIQELLPAHPALPALTAITLQHYQNWYRGCLPLLERRATLLHDWRTRLKSRAEQLRPELIRYADVVGATCIGIASLEGLEDLDFDLVIVDEAGQICLPDLLVPLVRAKRAVLVGDHQQLPPFVDNEVLAYLERSSQRKQGRWDLFDEETDSEEFANLLIKSAFELLFASAASNAYHFIPLTRQYRMPQAIADFASEHFYNRRLRTVRAEKSLSAPHHDPLFHRPLAFIDTSEVTNRRERSQRATEDWGATGYANPLEATLVARIAALYTQAGKDWVVIVPYRAQMQCILQQLREQLAIDEIDSLEARVATVDSFQGGERDRVIYSFTRSNENGEIGFLKELRRLNVAMTRAREQLVLIGDLSTLEYARNSNFRNLMASLHHYTQRNGELLTYRQCQQRLAALNQEKRDE